MTLRPAAIRFGLTPLLAIAALLVTAHPPPAQGSHYVTCRPPSFHLPDDTLLARGTSCRTARHIIAAFFAKAQEDGPRIEVRGFRCVDVPGSAGGEPVIRCRRGTSRIVYRGPQG